MKTLFLAQVTYRRTEYMQDADDAEQREEIRAVWADDEKEAARLVEEHYLGKTNVYSVYYNVLAVSVTQALGVP